MQEFDKAMESEDRLRVGFVIDNIPDRAIISKDAILSRDSYTDRWLLALSRVGVEATKYVPYREARRTETYEHKFGHKVKLIPVTHPLTPHWLLSRGSAPTKGPLALFTQRAEMLGFSMNLRKELASDRVHIAHYMSYFSSSFLFSPIAAGRAQTITWWTGGDVPRGMLKWVWFFTLGPALSRAKGILIGDYPMRRSTLAWLLRGDRTKIHDFELIRVDQNLFRPLDRVEARKRLGLDQDSTEILSVISLIPPPTDDPNERQPYLMLRAFKSALLTLKNPSVFLTIVGLGKGLETLKALARDLGIDGRVRFVGRVEHDELPWHYGAADLVFVPYFMEKLNETNVLAESFSCKRMVVGFRRTEAASFSQPGGFLVNPRPEKAGVELSEILDQPRAMAVKSEEAYSRRGGFSVLNAGNELLSAYGEVLREQRLQGTGRRSTRGTAT